MQRLDLTLPTLEENLALDEALLLEAEAGGSEVLRFWEWPRPAVVLGAGCRLQEDVLVEACEADGVPIVRRSSGGGTVLLGSGCLLYSLILAQARSALLSEVRSSYSHIHEQLRNALALPDLEEAGTSDLALAGRKCSGTAQQRKRTHLLHHGTLLYAFDAGLVARYLRPPSRQPEYRQGREHAGFLTNLPLSATELRSRLADGWQANAPLGSWPEERVRLLCEDKYRLREWTTRR